MKCDKEDIGLLFKIVSGTIEKEANKDLKKWGLTLAQMRILGFLKHRQEENLLTSQKDIERYLEVSHPTVIGVLAKLEEKKLIRTEFDCQDKRVKHVYTTAKEEELHQNVMKSRKEMEKKLTEALTETERTELVRLLNKIRENILPCGE